MVLPSGHLESLLAGTLALLGGRLPHLRPTQLRMPEGQATEALAKHLFGRGLAVIAKKESRRIDDIGMAPAVGDDAGNVPPGVKPVVAEELGELRTHRRFDLHVAHVEQLHARERALLWKRHTR